MLEDLHILDVLELAGSQAKAGVALAMHQTTVGRSLQLMQKQLRLIPRQGSSICRHGHNACLHHLRLAYREHRLMEGQLRIGSDLMHQGLLDGIGGLIALPPRFRGIDHWLRLIDHALLDGAIVSSFALEPRADDSQTPSWPGVVLTPLGSLSLTLIGSSPGIRRVLVPRRSAAPLLHQTLIRLGYPVEQQPQACQDEMAWIKRARDRQLALPITLDLVRSDWLLAHGLQPLRDPPQLEERLWLVLPDRRDLIDRARPALNLLRRRLILAQMRAKTELV